MVKDGGVTARILLSLVAAFPILVNAQGLPIAEPESVGMSSDRLARLGPFLDQYVEKGDGPGYVTVIARRGKVVYHEARGFREHGSDEPMPIDAIFEIASMTKPITVVSALMLMESGRFNMLDPVSEFIPEFGDLQVQEESGELVSAKRDIQIHDLFTHTSGVDDPISRVEKSAYRTLGEYLEYVSTLPLQAQPGTQWIYGDSHDVLGHLIEVVSDQSLIDFWQENIFDPLGMSDAHFWLPPDKEYRRAILLADGKNDPLLRTRFAEGAAERGTFVAGAWGLHMTAADYWVFCQMLLNNGEFEGRRYLSPSTVKWIRGDHASSAKLPERFYEQGIGFGLGVAVLQGSTSSPAADGTYYWGGGGGTAFWIDPQNELVGVVMGQSRRDGRAVRSHLSGLQQIVYGAILE